MEMPTLPQTPPPSPNPTVFEDSPTTEEKTQDDLEITQQHLLFLTSLIFKLKSADGMKNDVSSLADFCRSVGQDVIESPIIHTDQLLNFIPLFYMSALAAIEKLRRRFSDCGDQKNENECQGHLLLLLTELRDRQSFATFHQNLFTNRTPLFIYLEGGWLKRWGHSHTMGSAWPIFPACSDIQWWKHSGPVMMENQYNLQLIQSVPGFGSYRQSCIALDVYGRAHPTQRFWPSAIREHTETIVRSCADAQEAEILKDVLSQLHDVLPPYVYEPDLKRRVDKHLQRIYDVAQIECGCST